MSNYVRLFFCGDFCSTPSTKNITVSEELSSVISSCDFKLCNFEVPLKPNEIKPQKGKYYQNDDAPAFLEELGFNLFSFANNHAFDYGLDGWKKTMSAFKHTPFGSGSYEDAYKVKIVEKDGIKIGFLPLCYAARWGVFDNYTDKNTHACAWVNDLKVNHVIIEAKKQVDYLIILPHDGIEYVNVPLPETRARYRDFIDYGADAVIGSHPHCPQGWEEYNSKPIFYSLGNFLFNSKSDYSFHSNLPHWYEGRCLILNVGMAQEKISYEVINTRNENNKALTIDQSSASVDHNHKICSYLSDEVAYHNELIKELTPIVKAECTIPTRAFYHTSIKSCLKNLIYVVYSQVTHRRRKEANVDLERLMKDDTRRASFLRIIEENTHVFSYH
jgi:poly-gamma-glutamate synthesis protein (capsule biosynthesis protein)